MKKPIKTTHLEDNHNEIILKIKEAEHRLNDQMVRFSIDLKRDMGEIKSEVTELKDKVEPMFELFSSAKGFDGVSKWILKFLAGLGAAIIGLYTLIEFIRKLSK